MLYKSLDIRVFNQILQLIESGEFSKGSKLPSERKLAEILGTSRNAVREAQIALEAKRYIKVMPRSGSYIRDTPLLSLQDISSFELTEASALFDAEIAALAATLITKEELLELESYFKIMSGKMQSDMTCNEAYTAFHKVIARSTKNKVMIFVSEVLWKMRLKSKDVQTVCSINFIRHEQGHKAILQAMKKGDSAAARQAMRAHFTAMIEALLDYSEEEAYKKIQRQTTKSRSRFLLVSE